MPKTQGPTPRPDLTDVPAYRAGRRAAPRRSGPVYSLASNETVFGPLPGVLEALGTHLAQVHRYPDPGVGDLTHALCEHLAVEPEQVTTGTGSVAICQQAVVAMCRPGDEVVYAWRSFEAYPIITKLAGAQPVPVPLRPDGTHDLVAMAAAVNDRTRVVFLCTPNNPTGPSLSPSEVAQFLASLPPTILVVLDEAYHEFAEASLDAEQLVDGVELARTRPGVLALRTFSKAYGLAGLRVGYGVAAAPVIGALRRTALPFGVSTAAAQAAVASLRPQVAAEMRERVAQVVAERDRVVRHARSLGWYVPQASGNYYWLPLRDQTEEFAAACEQRGVTVRAFPGEGVRVTVGEPVANEIVLSVLTEEFVPGGADSP